MATKYTETLALIAQGDWDRAHQLIQDYDDQLACLIHAYLHWQEGDLNNARYWYKRAGQSMPDNSLEQEFEKLSEIATSEI